jgi:hypothetical protein
LTKLPSVGNLRDSLGDPAELAHPVVNTTIISKAPSTTDGQRIRIEPPC